MFNIEIGNPINWEKYNCSICNVPLHINPKGLEYEDLEMSYREKNIIFLEISFSRRFVKIRNSRRS